MLSGTPTAAAASTTYTYSVTDADGDSASLPFTITVAPEVVEPGDTAAAAVIPLFTPAGDVRQGIARIINHSGRSGTVRIHGTDDAGRSYGPATLAMDARSARDFDSNDLEQGSAAKGLSGGLGDGSGSWRLRLETDLAIEAAAYVRTADGFLASMHDVARTATSGNGCRTAGTKATPGRRTTEVRGRREPAIRASIAAAAGRLHHGMSVRAIEDGLRHPATEYRREPRPAFASRGRLPSRNGTALPCFGPRG